MIFIQLKNEEWWEYDAKHSRLYNIRGGHRSADNIDLSKAIYFENWHDLYKQTGFNPLIDNINMWHCGWISPYGDFYPCEAHEADAEYIYSLVYGEEHCYYSDKLIAIIENELQILLRKIDNHEIAFDSNTVMKDFEIYKNLRRQLDRKRKKSNRPNA